MGDVILCDHPGPAGSTCTKPYGHSDQDGHLYAMTMEIPPDIGGMFSAMLDDLEQATARAKKQERHYRFWKYTWLVLAAVYVVLIIVKVVS